MLGRLIVVVGILLGVLLHVDSLYLNSLLTIPDSFSYLQMASYLKDLKLEGLGTGWFGPLYSGFIALSNSIFSNDMLAAKVVNVILIAVGACILFLIGRKYLNGYYCVALVLLYGLSSSLLYYKINILSENLYIPLFLLLVLLLHKFLEKEKGRNTFFIGVTIGLMYLTRGEAFIYLGAVVVLIFFLSLTRFLTIGEFLKGITFLIIGFGLISAPYIYYLHTITGEWGLTNKGGSNVRQAMMRGVENMDDAGFEKAVGELDETKTKLIGGFAGGLKYEKPLGDYSLKNYIMSNPDEFFDTFKQNQKKLYLQTVPNIILGDIVKFSKDVNYPFAQKFPFLFLLYIPFLFLIYGLLKMIRRRELNLIVSVFPLFLTASIFFTLFFVLERYFIVFLPIAFIVMLYGCQTVFGKDEGAFQIIKFFITMIFIIGIQGVGFWYFQHQGVDTKYQIKKNAGEWIYLNKSTIFPGKESVKIMERWPIVTYYSGEKERWLTPYTDKVSDLVTYAKANQIDLLVVDTLDFLKYRPELKMLLVSKWKHPGLQKVTELNYKGNKVILYKFIY